MSDTPPTKRVGDALDIAKFLNEKTFPEDFDHVFEVNGISLPAVDALAWLSIERARGRKVLPLAHGCDQPCQRSADCAGFDFGGRGCPGYSED